MDDGNLPVKSSWRDLGERQVQLTRVAELVARLLSHYWMADDPMELREAQACDWLEDLVEFPVECIEAACREWRRNKTRRPTPADVRALAIAEFRRHNPSEATKRYGFSFTLGIG